MCVRVCDRTCIGTASGSQRRHAAHRATSARARRRSSRADRCASLRDTCVRSCRSLGGVLRRARVADAPVPAHARVHTQRRTPRRAARSHAPARAAARAKRAQGDAVAARVCGGIARWRYTVVSRTYARLLHVSHAYASDDCTHNTQVKFERAFMHWTAFAPDAHRGLDLGAAAVEVSV
jgi:hypothetical protein